MKLNEPDNGPPSIAKPLARVLAKGKDWSLSEYICSAGPEDRPFEEQHRQVTIAAVIEGSFVYRADNGTSLLHPGGFLLGNPGRCYECGHDHSRGDRCLALHVEPHYFEEIAASCTSTSYRFPVGMLTATSDLLPQISMLEALTASCELMFIEERVPSLIEAVLRVVSGSHPSSARTSARDERLVSEAFRYIEDHASEALELDGLATRAGMSKYHFLRTFRRTAGVTPYQFLLNVRLRRAAVRIATTQTPISTIAFEEGFGDLSTFNRRFHKVFGVPPKGFRSAPLA